MSARKRENVIGANGRFVVYGECRSEIGKTTLAEIQNGCFLLWGGQRSLPEICVCLHRPDGENPIGNHPPDTDLDPVR